MRVAVVAGGGVLAKEAQALEVDAELVDELSTVAYRLTTPMPAVVVDARTHGAVARH